MLRQLIRKIVNTAGYDIAPVIPPDIGEPFLQIYRDCKNYTATSIERMFSLYQATRYVMDNKIPGDIVECGVWKGGSSMICALTLELIGESYRKIYMYDTYSGMSEPTENDINYKGEKSIDEWRKSQRVGYNKWCFSPLEDVKKAMYSTGYPPERTVFVKGKVENTIPGTIPEKIALLRLDTDWYESTYHELKYLFPRLSPGGVLIIDDYGHHQGARKAVDQYIMESNTRILLNRIDYTGRIGVKREIGDSK